MGEKNHFFGKKHSNETIELMKIKKIGNKYSLGCVHSKESKEKQSKSMKGRFVGEKHPMWGKYHSEESIQKNRNSQPNAKSILCFKDKIFVKEFNSISEASRQLNLFISSISRILVGKQKTSGGYTFKYK